MTTWTLTVETLNTSTGAWEIVDRDIIPELVRGSAQATIDREDVVEAALESGAQPGTTMRITLRSEDDTILAETEHYTIPDTMTIIDLTDELAETYDRTASAVEESVQGWISELIDLDGQDAILLDDDTLTGGGVEGVRSAAHATWAVENTDEDTLLWAIEDATRAVDAARSTLDGAVADRDAAIRAALRGGVRYADIQTASGLSRSHLDNIRTGRRR